MMSNSGSIGDPILDLESEIDDIRSQMTDRDQLFLSWVARGLLNWSLSRSSDIDALLASSPDRSRLFSTIIDRRDDAIVAYIRAHPTENIAIVYGALHFNGVYESLQRQG